MAAIVAMAFVVAAIVAMAGSHGSHVKETCSLLFEAMAAIAVILEAIAAAMAALGSHGCHAMGFDNFHIKKLVISGHGWANIF